MNASILRRLLAVLVFLRTFFVRSAASRYRWVASPLRATYRAAVRRLVVRTQLFDPAFYRERNPDVVAADWDPLAHYVAAGDAEGRFPMPLFDPAYYRARVGEPIALNALLHYVWFGRNRGIAPSPWFDPAYYLQHNPDVAASGQDPLRHFIRHGAREGRSPCPEFDTTFYLQANPDVAESGDNPLIHYLAWGRAEGRKRLPWSKDAPEDELAPDASAPFLPSVPARGDWDAATARAERVDARIDVVIPVYKGRAETLRSILSALNAPVKIPFAVHVINDCSPDEVLSEELRALAARGLFELHVNEENLGFVRTANRGMALHADRDVVLLNSDAEVHGDWLDRLHHAAHRQAHTGTVTPLSNNATICSYPRAFEDNPFPLETTASDLDRLASQCNAGIEVEAPTGHGFCLYLKRDCLRDVGTFDEAAFGKGYGEENDLCQRALRKGWRNILCPDVYVWHWGSASFKGERTARVSAALQEIARRYPGYDRDIAVFAGKDPLGPSRRALDWQRLRQQVRAHNVLVVCHARGGGTERALGADIAKYAGQGSGTFLLRPSVNRPGHVVLSHPSVRNVPNLLPVKLSDAGQLSDRIRDLEIDQIVVHSLVDFPVGASDDIASLAASLDIPFDVFVHDYEAICPRLTLTDQHGRYCREPDVAACGDCLKRLGAEIPVTDNKAWRLQRESFLRKARSVVVPDDDVAIRLNRYFSELRIEIRPHEDPGAIPRPLSIDTVAHPVERPLRIAVVGAISRHKGYDILRASALHAQRQKLPLEFVLMGYSADDAGLATAGVRVTGRYAEDAALDTLRALKPDVVWLPALWPETYSFTLSLALRAEVPAVAFDLGAIARRLRAADCVSNLMPLASMSDPIAVARYFLDLRRVEA